MKLVISAALLTCVMQCCSCLTQQGTQSNRTASQFSQTANSNANYQASSTSAVKITRAEYGEDWPFTVDEGILACEMAGGYKTVTFTANGTTYIVNAMPKGIEVRGDKRYVRILGTIWAKNPKGPGPYKAIGAIIDRGMSLCR